MVQEEINNILDYSNPPTKIRLEACSICQLQCPLCPTGTGRLLRIKKGFLQSMDFKNLLQLNPFIEQVELSNWGEAFLNPQIAKIFRIAYHYKVKLTLGNGVNLNTVSEKTLKALVLYKVNFMIVSIDGTDQRVYEHYRVNGNLKKVIKNIEIINRYKQIYNSEYPKLIWKFILFGHNEHQIDKAQEMAKELNMDFSPKRSWNADWSPLIDPDEVFKKTGKLTTPEAIEREKRPTGWDLCLQVWEEPQINWNGDLLGCCANRGYPTYGNIFESGLLECLNSPKYQKLKQTVSGLIISKDEYCQNCWRYTNEYSMNRDGRLLKIIGEKYAQDK